LARFLADALLSWSFGSLANALPPLPLDDRSHGLVFCVGNHCIDVLLQAQLQVLGVEGSRSLLCIFCCFYGYSKLLATILVVYNLHFEGSLIADL
jgi:hypothetical protein